MTNYTIGFVAGFLVGLLVGYELFKPNPYVEYAEKMQGEMKKVCEPQPKDTTTYHWSDNFTDSQLREMCREEHIKLR